MKAIKNTLAIVISVMLAFALCAPAFANQTVDVGGNANPAVTTDFKLTISNAQKDRTYEIYKLFDTNGAEGTAVLYTTTEDLSQNAWFELDTVKNTIKVRDNVTLDDATFNSAAFKAWAETHTKVATAVCDTNGASSTNASNVIEFINLEPGYYYIKVTPAPGENTTNPNAPGYFAGAISVDTTNKWAKMSDKNGQPHYTEDYGKKIQDGDGADAPSGSYGIDKEIPYAVSIKARNYNNQAAGAPPIYMYYVYDSINPLMTYSGAPAVTVEGTAVTSGLRYTFFTIPYEDVQAWAGTTKTWNEVVTHFGATGTNQITTDPTKAVSFRVDIPWYSNVDVTKTYAPFVDRLDIVTTPGSILPGPDGLDDTTGRTIEQTYGTPRYADGSEIIVSYKARIDSAKVTDPSTLISESFENKAAFSWYDITMDSGVFQPQDPINVAPVQRAKNYTVDLLLKKVDENGRVLTGASFKLSGTAVTTTRVVTESFVADNTNGTYWKLKNGRYTTDDPATVWQSADPNAPYYTTVAAKVGTAVFDVNEYESTTDKYRLETTETLVPSNAAAGAEYAVSNAGRVTWGNLGAGIYDLEETVAPNGYNKMDSKKIQIVFNDPQSADSKYTAAEAALLPGVNAGDLKPLFEAFEVSEVTDPNTNVKSWVKSSNGIAFTLEQKGSANELEWDATANSGAGGWVVKTAGTVSILSATVENKKGAELPSTGGIGTTIFYIAGALLIVVAGVVLFARRRVSIGEAA